MSILAWFAQKTYMLKSSIFSRKFLTNPLENFDFLDFFVTSLFWSKKTFFSIQNIKKRSILAWSAHKKKTHGKNFHFLTKTMDQPFWKMSIFFVFLKRCFPSLTRILFYPEYQKAIFSGLTCPKGVHVKKFDFFSQIID